MRPGLYFKISNFLCVGGYGANEDINHQLVHCNFFRSIWHLVLQWLSVVFVSPVIITDHLCQFDHLGGFSKHQMVNSASVWLSGV